MNNIPFLVLFLLIIAFLFGVDFIFYIIYVVFGVYALNRWVIPRSFKKLLVRRDFASHGFIGDLVHVQLNITNLSRIPIAWLQIRESLPVGLKRGEGLSKAITVRGKGNRQFTYEIQATRRGYYRIGPLSVSLGDLFGFANIEGQIDPAYITIYPKIIPLTELGLSSNLPFGTVSSKQKIFEDPARPIGVRDYLIGDTPRHINWKATAKQRKLLVRTHQPAISLETFILLNLNKDEYSRRHRYDSSEWAIIVAASLAAHLEKQRQAVGLGLNGLDPLIKIKSPDEFDELFDEDSGRLGSASVNEEAISKLSWKDGLTIPNPILPRRGRAHLMKVLEILARIEAGPTGQFSHWISKACINISWGTTLLVVSPHGNEEICYAIHRLVKKGFNPILIIVEPYSDLRIVRERSRSLGFQAIQVSSEQEINRWRRYPVTISR